MQRLVQLQTERQDYETPPALVAALAAEFGPFEIDLAATEANKKAPRCFTPEQDSLAQDWTGLVGWLNPPYGKMTGPFVKKASEAKARVVCLLPARTDTAWFHDYVQGKAKVIRFLRGRPKFLLNGMPVLDPKTGRPASGKFPSMVVVFDNRMAHSEQVQQEGTTAWSSDTRPSCPACAILCEGASLCAFPDGSHACTAARRATRHTCKSKDGA